MKSKYTFSDFFTIATKEEKEELILEVLREANEEQRKLMETLWIMEKETIKRFIRGFVKGLMLTVALPFTFFMALGYWTESKDNISFKEAFKRVL